MINTILGVLFFLVAITIIVVVHEFGHLIVAKRNGVKCFEFSIGMGPKLFRFYTDKDGTVYNVRAIPLGGYVMMAGEEEAQDMKFDKEESLMNKKPWQKIKILFAGAFMNFVLGFVILFIAFFIFGIPSPVNNNQVEIQEASPASQAGLVSGDKITEVDGVVTDTYEQISKQLEGKTDVEITYDHEGTESTTTLTKEQIDCETSVIGIAPVTEQDQFNLFGSLRSAAVSFWAVISSVGQSLQLLFNGTAGVSDLMGPVGIATASKSVVTSGLFVMLYTIAFLSINIGIVNILPFPALDGGRIVLAVIELVTKRRVPEKLELYLNFAGFILLMGLFVVVTFSDVGRLGTAEYYNLDINSDIVCARDASEVNYHFELEPIDQAKMPEELTVELKISDGQITTYNDQAVGAREFEATYTTTDEINQLVKNGVDLLIYTETDVTSPLDLTVKIYDEKGDAINQLIYRIDR